MTSLATFKVGKGSKRWDFLMQKVILQKGSTFFYVFT